MGAKLLKSRYVSADSGVFSGDAGKYYRRFYNRMATILTRPGLISLDEDDDWCWFSETMDVVAYDLSMEERNPRRFTPTPDMEDMPELIMEEILTGIRPTQT